ncbi:MAG: hypothetical protein C5B50_30605 [Verrucomicrobia bacterium]|nr:MAG: hypothetical protein C5B50_30605 [Verrucomicrobiota bacterium]
MTNEQMELSFSNQAAKSAPAISRPHCRRAGWWIARMRKIVDRALEWHPAPSPRPEQGWFTGTYRLPQQTLTSVLQSHSNQHEICE